MKKFKFGVLAMALISMLGFTSCLESSDPGPTQFGIYAKVSGGMYGVTFIDAGGTTLVPTQMITSTPTSSMALIYGTIAEDEVMDAETNSIEVTLMQDPIYLREMVSQLASAPAEEKTVGLYDMRCSVWGKYEYFIIESLYFLKKGTTQETTTTARNDFRINVYYDSNETGTSSGTLKLHVRCEPVGIDMSSEEWGKEYNVGYTEAVFVRADQIIAQYRANNGGEYPKRIEVEYEKSSLAYATSDSQMKMSQTYTIEMPDMSEN